MNSHEVMLIMSWLFTRGRRSERSERHLVNSQDMMVHYLVAIHDPGSGFFSGGWSPAERAGEVGDGDGGWSEAMTVGGGGRSGPDGAKMGRFRPVTGRKSLESEAMTLFFRVRPEREP